MNVPSKYLFYDGLPSRRDKEWIMAANGYATLPSLDNSYGAIDVGDSVGPAPQQGMDLSFNYPRQEIRNNTNNPIDYILGAAGLVDAAIPDGRIHRNYPTTPLPVYNPYPNGTGSQAIYEHGGDIEEAEGGHWIQKAVNPKHKGYCTPMTKSTCTPRRKALAKTFKKHHGFHEDGGEVIPNNMNPFYHGSAEDGLMMYEPYAGGGEMYESGGQLSPDKAKEMLRDGTANGKKLTAKQKRYFGFIAGGGHPTAPDGTQIQTAGVKSDKPWYGNTADRRKVGFSDLLSYNLVNKGEPNQLREYQGAFYKDAVANYGPDKGRKLFDEVNIYNQRPEIQKYSPQQRIQSFYDMQSNDPDVQNIKNEYRNFGGGPLSLYNSSSDMGVQQQSSSAYKPMTNPQKGALAQGRMYEHGGSLPEGSIHDLPEEKIASLLKQGYHIEYL